MSNQLDLQPLTGEPGAGPTMSALGSVQAAEQRGLLDWTFFGVPFLRAVLQIGGAVGAMYLLGDVLRPMSVGLQLLALSGIFIVGSYLGLLVWNTVGEQFADFINEVFPFSFDF